MTRDIDRFLDDLEDSRLEPHLRLILDEIDAYVMAEDHERFLDRNSWHIIPKEMTFDERDSFLNNLLEEERSSRARKWNSRLTSPVMEDYKFPEKEGFHEPEKD